VEEGRVFEGGSKCETWNLLLGFSTFVLQSSKQDAKTPVSKTLRARRRQIVAPSREQTSLGSAWPDRPSWVGKGDYEPERREV
jgi:hypothetical protein